MAKGRNRKEIEILRIENRWLRRQNHRLERNKDCFDHLTGAFNRKKFDQELNDALAEVKSKRQRYDDKDYVYGLLFIDLNDFKTVNDDGGHLAGDEVLRNVAQALKKVLRQDDVLARFGGDEFAIIAKVRHQQDLNMLAERARQAIVSAQTLFGKQVWVVTGSIGSTLFCPKDTRECLIARADKAMYEAKRQVKAGGSHCYRQ